MKYDYDESGAIYSYFALTLLGFFLIPSTIGYVKDFFGLSKATAESGDGEKRFTNFCACEPCQKKRALLGDKEKTEKKFGKRFALWIVGWILFAYFTYVLVTAKAEKHELWDPYKILELPYDATMTDIKRQYRVLSLKYHPDKADESVAADAEAKFIELSKAYQSLTDDDVRKNWLEHGNPDGQQSLSLGIALPAWLVSSDNMIKVLIFYALVIGVALPYLVNRWWNNAKIYTKDKIMNLTMEVFYQEIKENLTYRKVMEIFSVAAEFRSNLPTRPTDDKALTQLIELIDTKVHSEKLVSFERPKKYTALFCLKAYYLLAAHLLRIPVEDEGLKKDQEFVLENSLHLILGMLQITLARSWLSTSISLMNLSQMVVQAIPEVPAASEHYIEFLQLPHLTVEILKHFKKKFIRTIPEFLEMKEADRRSLLRTLDDSQVADVVKIARSIPSISIKSADFVTLGEPQVIAEGLVTLVVKLQLKKHGQIESPTGQEENTFDDVTKSLRTGDEDVNFDDDEDEHVVIAPKGPITNPNEPVHAPYLQGLEKKPFWWVILSEPRLNNFICAPVKVHDLVTSKTVKMQFVAPPREGVYSFVLYVKSDSYVGLDLKKEVKMHVAPKSAATKIEDDLSDISEDDGQSLRQQLEDMKKELTTATTDNKGGVGTGLK